MRQEDGRGSKKITLHGAFCAYVNFEWFFCGLNTLCNVNFWTVTLKSKSGLLIFCDLDLVKLWTLLWFNRLNLSIFILDYQSRLFLLHCFFIPIDIHGNSSTFCLEDALLICISSYMFSLYMFFPSWIKRIGHFCSNFGHFFVWGFKFVLWFSCMIFKRNLKTQILSSSSCPYKNAKWNPSLSYWFVSTTQSKPNKPGNIIKNDLISKATHTGLVLTQANFADITLLSPKIGLSRLSPRETLDIITQVGTHSYWKTIWHNTTQHLE
jgi:hypothetical protein